MPQRYRVECEAFDAADEWAAVLPAQIAADDGAAPVAALLAHLRQRGVECRLVKTSRSGLGESHLLDRKTAIGNSQAAVQLHPIS